MSLETSGGWELDDCYRLRFSASSLLKQGWRAFPTPLGWVSEQSGVQVVHPAERPRLSPGGRRSSSESSGNYKGMLGEEAVDKTIPELRRGSSGEGWMDELSTLGLASSSDRLAP